MPPLFDDRTEWLASTFAEYSGYAVQVAFRDGGNLVLVRNPGEPVLLTVPIGRWRAFCDGVANGELRGPERLSEPDEDIARTINARALRAIADGIEVARTAEVDDSLELARGAVAALRAAGYQIVRGARQRAEE